jgi:hypothetical protein
MEELLAEDHGEFTELVSVDLSMVNTRFSILRLFTIGKADFFVFLFWPLRILFFRSLRRGEEDNSSKLFSLSGSMLTVGVLASSLENMGLRVDT